ncbi:MAG: 4Fe-4S dicluster domain-containing protein [SAR324 cluster bacterium]|nr:4Fe-4S dicluster domain-containing protein [SAR324 cluster bacterium]
MERGMRRRDFFKVLAAGGATATAIAGCSDPPEKLIPFLLPPDNIEFSPGIPVDYATTCSECPAGCGMVIRTREGRAIKAEGNPDHPVNRGALCIRGQASMQTLYNPARIRSAMLQQNGQWSEVDWAQGEAAFVEAIRNVSDPAGIVLLTDRAEGTRGHLLDQWLAALGASPKLVLDPLGQNAIKTANEKTFGRKEIPQYHIDQATFLLNFGSDFLETWLSPVKQNRQFAEMHAVKDGETGKGTFVHVGPHRSLTGVNADRWVSVNPGSEIELALALAKSELQRRRRELSLSEASRLESFFEPYTLERAAQATGADLDSLKKLAQDLGRAERSLVLVGGTTTASNQATALQIAVNLLNYVAGNIGGTVQFGANQEIDLSTPYAEVAALFERMHAGEVTLLIVDGANPLYYLPAGVGVAEALDKVGTIVSLSSAWDETTHRANIVLPSLSAYERWGDSFPQRGVFALKQPVMAPVFPLKASEDTLLAAAEALELTDLAGVPNFQEYLKTSWQEIQRDAGSKEPFDTFWRRSLQNGGVFRQVAFSSVVRLNLEVLGEDMAAPELGGEGLVLIPTASLRHRSGEGAVSSWLQEIPDPVSQVVWDSWADINPKTAAKLGIRHGDQIRISSPHGEVLTAAYLHYGVHPDAIAIPLGQGRTQSGQASEGVGLNVVGLLPARADAASGDFAYLSTRVSVAKGEGKAFLVQLDGSPRQLDREIIQTMTLEQYDQEEKPLPAHGGEHGGQPRPITFYRPRDETPGYYEPYRWGMTVDVDRCTGCSACVAACYAENNIPVVGKERTALGREMSWIRIERFLEGEGDDYQTLMQPMMCQHCENAGCEAVCPVYATYHTPEGLNAQVYNRCVGTRYCSNNCAYKVRRFNWFEYEFESPLHMQLNPDVTVRSKGVMEKCTFCVQRIHRARWDADAKGREIRDGEVTPACVQTCPTQALTFGNLSDPGSQVSRNAMRGEAREEHRLRQYEVLKDTASLPAVTYLRKVTRHQPQEA